MPVVDGLHVLQEMGRHAELASVPVMMMSANATDLARLQAFQLGAADFIPKPFTVLEVILRARRWARASQRDTERVVLRGALADVEPAVAAPDVRAGAGRPASSSVTRDQLVAWIDFVDGTHRARAVVRGRRRRARVLLKVLDWKHGYFELAGGARPPRRQRRARHRDHAPPARARAAARRSRRGATSARSHVASSGERFGDPRRRVRRGRRSNSDDHVLGRDGGHLRRASHGARLSLPAYDRSRITSGCARSTSSTRDLRIARRRAGEHVVAADHREQLVDPAAGAGRDDVAEPAGLAIDHARAPRG